MPSSSVCWGIEIGAAAIKAIKLEAIGDGAVKVLDFAVIQHPKVLSTPGVDANDVLRVSLGALTSQYDLSKSAIAVSVPGHSAFARFAKLPPVEPKKVPDIVKFEAMQQIPFPLENVEWDYQTFVSPDSPDVEVGIFAITREKVNERLNMLADVGIFPNYVILSPIAVYNALAYDLQFDPKTPGTIIVDVGTTSTDLVIATPGRMWVRTFHTGGHQFTDALVNQFQLSYPKAEKLKRDAEDTKHARQVFQAMRPVFTDLTQEIQRSIGYYQSINKEAELTRLIGVGSTFLLPGLRKYLKQQLSMDVYRVDAQTPFKRATIAGDREAAFHEVSTGLVTAYGLALQGLGLNAVGGNLMPTTVLRKAMWKEKVGWFGLAAGIAALASAIMFVRPVKDYFDVNNAIPDASIQTTQNKGDALKGQATSEGVTASSEPDLRAANMVALLDKRGVYEMIMADVGRLFAKAEDAVPTWGPSLKGLDGKPLAPVPGPAFSLVKFETEYLPPEGAASPDAPPGMAPMNSAGGPEPTFPRVRCTLTATTTQPEPLRFVQHVALPWFQAAAARRPGVPYLIMGADWRVELQLASAAMPSTSPGFGAGDTVPGAVSEGGRGGRSVMRGAIAGEGGGPPRRGGYPTPSMGAGEMSSPGEGQSQLDAIAPLVAPETTGPAVTGVITITWYAVLKPDAPTTPEEAPK